MIIIICKLNKTCCSPTKLDGHCINNLNNISNRLNYVPTKNCVSLFKLGPCLVSLLVENTKTQCCTVQCAVATETGRSILQDSRSLTAPLHFSYAT